MSRKKIYGSPKYGYKYASHRISAERRGISFELTYGQWIKIWIWSGHLHERGKKVGQYCMARFDDKGPYAVGNVKIILRTENTREQSEESRAKIKLVREKGTKTLIDYLGNAMTIPQAIYASGNEISTGNVLDRLRRGWPHREAVEVPVGNNRSRRPPIELG